MATIKFLNDRDNTTIVTGREQTILINFNGSNYSIKRYDSIIGNYIDAASEEDNYEMALDSAILLADGIRQ